MCIQRGCTGRWLCRLLHSCGQHHIVVWMTCHVPQLVQRSLLASGLSNICTLQSRLKGPDVALRTGSLDCNHASIAYQCLAHRSQLQCTNLLLPFVTQLIQCVHGTQYTESTHKQLEYRSCCYYVTYSVHIDYYRSMNFVVWHEQLLDPSFGR